VSLAERSSPQDRAAAAYHIGGLIPLGRHAAGGESAIVLLNAAMKIAAVMPCAEAE
jgi:hypothetical protein